MKTDDALRQPLCIILKLKMMEQRQWRKLNGAKIKVPIEDEVRNMLLKEKAMGHDIKVCIGTDSQVKTCPNIKDGRGRETEFATVIVFVRKGKGAFMYIHNETTKRKMSVKERMLDEVARSIDVAYSLCNLFIAFNVDMEVHADINTNPNFKSNSALKEAMGYIMGMPVRLGHPGGGFAFKAKPHAFASSQCADRMVH